MSSSSQSVSPHSSKKPTGGFREVFILAVPVMLSHLSEALMGVVDSAMVGRLGATELAAVGFATVWLWTVFSLLLGTATGVQTFVSQFDSAGDTRQCGTWTWQGFYAVFPLGILLTVVIVWLTAPALALLGPSAELQAVAAEYVYTRILGELGYVVLLVHMSFFRGLEDMRTPLYVVVFAVVENAILDYLLIFGKFGFPELGVAGAGIATSISTWSGAAILFVLFRRRSISQRYHTRMVAPNLAKIRRFLWTSAPIGGQWCIGMASFAIFNTLVARMGDEAMAVSQAFTMLMSLSFMQAIGISIASATLVGRYIGVGAPDAAMASYRSAMKLAMCLAFLIAILFLSIPDTLMRLFTDDPELVAMGRPLLMLGAFYQFLDAAYLVAEGSLRGAGDTRWAFVVELTLGWGLLVPAAYLLGVVLEGGLMGAWYGGTIHVVVLSFAFIWRFRSRAWQKIRI